MQFAKRILGGVNPSFLARSYILGFALFGVMAWTMHQAEPNILRTIPKLALPLVCTLFYPFSKLVWNELRDFFMASNVIWMNAVVLFMLKATINVLLWALSPLIAPIGVLYLWYRTRPAGAADGA